MRQLRELGREIAELLQRAAAEPAREMRKMWPSHSSACDAMQRVVRLAEVRHVVHVRRADQAAVEA